MPEIHSDSSAANRITEQLRRAFEADDAVGVRQLLAAHPEVKARVNEPMTSFDAPAITAVRSRSMLDVLLEAGADINAKTRWWAGGFGLLHCADPELAAYAITRGAMVDIHAAAKLGMTERVRELVSRDQGLVKARGGDGQTPLHFASTIEIAKILLDHGAEIDARDEDHESTPGQYMVRDRQGVLRYLIERGCQTDVLMAAALGDQTLAEEHLLSDPACIRLRVSNKYFPMVNPRAGGTIYQWTLGWHVSAVQVAKDFGHAALSAWLMDRSPTEVQLVNYCWNGDEAAVDALLLRQPDLIDRLTDEDRRQIAHAARNNNTKAVTLFLRARFPVEVPGQHGAAPLHWAAWHGNVEMVNALLAAVPPLEATDADYGGTALGWAIHGSENGWNRQSGNYPATVAALLASGARPPATLGGTEQVQLVLRRAQNPGWPESATS